MTISDFAGPHVEPVLKSQGETLETVAQLERDYAAAERAPDEQAKKRLNARLQPIYQRLASLSSAKPEPPKK